LRTDRPPTDDQPTTDRPTNLSFGKIQTAISPQGVVRSTSCLVLWWGFWGRQIEWHYFWFDKIQDGDSAAILENSNGDISARIIRFTLCLVLGWGFWGQWIEWCYFRFDQIQ